MIELIFKILGTGLSLWETKEKTKYQDKYIALKRAYYEELNKPDEERSDAVLDNLEFELRILCNSFSTEVGSKNVAVK